MIYAFYTFRYVDKLNNWVNEMASQGFCVEWVNSYHNVRHGEIEHLICMAREEEGEQGKLVGGNTETKTIQSGN